jgi:hypothetical protein
MAATTNDGDRRRKTRLVLWCLCLVCMTIVTVINFATDAGIWTYVSLACVVALVAGISANLVQRRRGA